MVASSRRKLARTALPFGFAVLALSLVLLASQTGIRAAPSSTTWYVNAATGNDTNNCLSPGTACATIGAAVGLALDGDTVEIAAGTYDEHSVEISDRITLTGAGADLTIVDAGQLGRHFQVYDTVHISNLRLQNGATPDDSDIFVAGGGALLVGASARLTLQDVVLIDNTAAGSGGGIFNLGRLLLLKTEVLSNTAGGGGGGIYNYLQGVITVTHSTLAHNSAQSPGAGGGAILAGGARLTVQDSSVTGNSAVYFGGGLSLWVNDHAVVQRTTLSGNTAPAGGALYVSGGTVTVTNATLTGNTAGNNYGGVYATGPTTVLALQSSTIAGNGRANTAGVGWNGIGYGNGATVTAVNTILADNQENNCASSSPPTSLGHNLSDDFTCGFTATGDLQGTDPRLAPLADYGGPTMTHALTPGSAAIDAGDAITCPATDARGITRPFDGDGDGSLLCDIGAFEARNQLSVADTSVVEGDAGAVTAAFTVTLAPTATTTVEVSYATADDTATAGVDYAPAGGTLTFIPGETQKVISVTVTGDIDDEPDETFILSLASLVNADLLDGVATGTIVDNDGLPSLTIADRAQLEGNLGSAPMTFDVTLSPAGTEVVTVSYATANGTATGGSDFAAASDLLVFQPGETVKGLAIDILGDIVDEGTSEAFSVSLSNPTNATLADDQAIGTITDDDSARLRHELGPEVPEGDSGTTPAVFTVTLTTPAAFVITVDYAVSSGFGDGGAKAGEDFVPISGTLTFLAGTTAQTYTVEILGDTDPEPDEGFSSLISNANAPIQVNGSLATILNDDNRRIYLPLIQR